MANKRMRRIENAVLFRLPSENVLCRELYIISDNLETLITSVECKKLSNFYLAIDFRTDPYVEPDIHHVNFSVFLRKSTGEHIIVPEFLFMDYYSDSDYEELY